MNKNENAKLNELIQNGQDGLKKAMAMCKDQGIVPVMLLGVKVDCAKHIMVGFGGLTHDEQVVNLQEFLEVAKRDPRTTIKFKP